jgi:tetratricopeptide (TPR) repeat protein
MTPRALLPAGALFFALLPVHSRAVTPTPAPNVVDSPEREQALELFDQYKMAQALPLLQKLAEANPRDVVIWERCGVAMASYSETLSDPAERKLARAKSREILLKAKTLGDDSNLLKTLLDLIPPDGGDATFSGHKDADDAMQQAEADFARGDFDKARAGYERALILDPKLYEAALFSGDACFKQKNKNNALAIEWFDRAIHIDPDRETAYRYWGDSLVDEGKMDEARAKCIDAIIAEPYVDGPWTGISQWADRNGVSLTPLKLQTHAGGQVKDHDVIVSVDGAIASESVDTAAWTAYAVNRSGWMIAKFKANFPGESAYRHTLAEEAGALHTMVTVLTGLAEKKDGGKPSDPALERLMKIDQAGLLEAYVLIERADEGIARDYAAYRSVHRDKLLRYLDEYVVPKLPGKN